MIILYRLDLNAASCMASSIDSLKKLFKNSLEIALNLTKA